MDTRIQKSIIKYTKIFTVLIWLSCNYSFSQEQTKAKSDSSSLLELTGFTQTLYYSSGHEERARTIAVFMKSAGDYFQKLLNFTPKTTLYVLAPQDWKSYATKPLQEVYGFPHNLDSHQLVIAAEDNDFWRSFLPDMDQLPKPMADQITEAYRQSDGSYSMRPFFDLLALHEMGHSYTAQAGLKMQRYWMGELFVNIMLHTFIVEQQPELIDALEAFPNMVIGAGTSNYNFTSLEDFETLYPTLGMGARNYGWYQCRLHSAAKDIYNACGKEILNKLWKALKTHQEAMTDEEFIQMLNREVHPAVANVFLEWEKKE